MNNRLQFNFAPSFAMPLTRRLALAIIPIASAMSQTPPQTHRATGAFEVKAIPKDSEPGASTTPTGRMHIEKVFSGDLEGTSKVEMLTAVTPTKGSAGYVAIEQVSGKLKGHEGTFVLQHSGTAHKGAQQLTITVVPESGTGQLTGIEGKFTIRIESGKHFYDFDYTL